MSPPSLDKNNPYSAPNANLNDDPMEGGTRQFVPDGKLVGSNRPMDWFSQGFEQFKAAPGIWIGLVAIFFVLIMVMSFVPFLGSIALNLLFPVFFGGLMLASRASRNNQEVKIDHLFAGFQTKFGPLALVGLFYLIGMIVLVVIMMVIGFVFIGGAAAMFGLSKASGAGDGAFGAMLGAGIGVIFLVMLLAFALSIPLAMSVWFAPALVVFHDMEPLDAMKASFTGCIKNWLPFLIFIILYIVFAVVATIPFLLGWLVLGPVIIGAMYAAYEDIYLN